MKATATALLGGLFILVTLGGCETANSRAIHPCPDPRPGVCTRDYRPVCGYASDSATVMTYGNDCEACGDPAVEGWLPGACPD